MKTSGKENDATWLRAQLLDELEHFSREARELDAEAEEHENDGDQDRAQFKRGCAEYAGAAAKSLRAMLDGKTRMEALAERLRKGMRKP